METENERRAKSLQTAMKDASKKDAELFNLKTFKKTRKHSAGAKEHRDDSALSPASSAFKGTSRFKANDTRSDDDGLSPTQTRFGALKLFPTKEMSPTRSNYFLRIGFKNKEPFFYIYISFLMFIYQFLDVFLELVFPKFYKNVNFFSSLF